MRKKIFLMTMCALGVLGCEAAPLSFQQALSRLNQNHPLKEKGRNNSGYELESTLYGSDGNAMAYVVNNTSGGFVILSANDVAYPVLGYSENGRWDNANVPLQLQDWLQGYCDQIEYAVAEKVTPEFGNLTTLTRASKAAIAPMIKSKWDQDAPYNNDCPMIGNRHCYTGCVATSMAQVMNYFKYPEKGSGTATVTVNSQRYTLDFSAKPFDWENMLDNYVAGTYTDTQAAAVAYLMQACGYSVNMSYGTSASGATSNVIANALKTTFNYDSNLRFEPRISYSGSEWDDMIYGSLEGGSPVIYNGNDLQVGHSFVCDGYDGNGFYHINWGWSGMSDGYYLLNALNPEALGTGGGTGGGYSFLQGAVLNIKKPTGQPTENQKQVLTAYGLIGFDNITKDALGNSVITVSLVHGYGPICGWRNESGSTMRFNIGGSFVDASSNQVVETQQGKFGGMYNMTVTPGAYYDGKIKLTVTAPSNLPDGEYKMVVVTRDNTVSDAEWIPVNVPYAYPNYITIRKDKGVISAASVQPATLKLKDLQVIGQLFYGRGTNVSFTVENPSDYELTEAVSVVLTDNENEIKFKSTNILVTVAPHSSINQNWTVLLYPQSGQAAVKEDVSFELGAVNEYSGESYGMYGTVTMKPNPGDPSVQLRSMSIPGAETEETEILGEKYNVLVVKDKNDFKVDLTIRVSKGYFNSNIYVDIVELAPNATSPNQTVPVKDQIFTKYVEMNAGETETFNIPVSFPEGESGKIYYIKAKYYDSSYEKLIGSLRFKVIGDSGVGEIEEEVQPEKYFSLMGMPITTPTSGEIVIVVKGSKTEKRKF